MRRFMSARKALASREGRSTGSMAMRKRWIWAVVLAVAAVAAYAGNAGTARATPQHGFRTVVLSKTTFDQINSHIQTFDPQFWNMVVQVRGASDLYLLQNTWQPGGSTGWHTHPGPSFVTVIEGSVTVYDGDDPTCTGHVYTANTPNNTFIDPGNGHVHIVRNETDTEAQTITVQLVPHDPTSMNRRIDAARPVQCPKNIV